MDWDGTERRGDYKKIDRLEEKINDLSVNMSAMNEKMSFLDRRINGSIDNIEKHIEHGRSWRISIIGVALMLILQILSFTYIYGQLNAQVRVNNTRLETLEEIHPRVVK